MPLVFFYQCDKCNDFFGGLEYVQLFKRNSGIWELLAHPSESFQIMGYKHEDKLTDEEVQNRIGIANIKLCKTCGNHVLANCDGPGWVGSKNNFVGKDECECGSKDVVSIRELEDCTCIKCKDGKIKSAGFSVS